MRWIAIMALWVGGCAAPSPEDEAHDTDAPPANKADGTLGDALEFAAACEPGETITIAVVGDVLLHGALQRQAYGDDDRFMSLWNGVTDLLAAADVAYANLEGPTAFGVDAYGRDVPDPGLVFDGVVYSSYPQFNYHPTLVDDLINTGIDIVSTANNHSLDRRGLGVDRTIDALETAGLPFSGTRRSDGSTPWHTFTDSASFRIAWLACTYGTNGIPDRDDQVLGCFDDEEYVLGLIGELEETPGVDAVIVTPHWGVEYSHTPRSNEMGLAHRMLDAGAVAVIGSHPHVVQPWERYVAEDGREGFVIYSLGNFVSNQSQLPRRSTALVYLGLKRRPGGDVVPYAARHVPLHLDRSGGRRELEAIDRVGGASDSRALTVRLLSEAGLIAPTPDPDLVPDCTPSE